MDFYHIPGVILLREFPPDLLFIHPLLPADNTGVIGKPLPVFGVFLLQGGQCPDMAQIKRPLGCVPPKLRLHPHHIFIFLFYPGSRFQVHILVQPL